MRYFYLLLAFLLQANFVLSADRQRNKTELSVNGKVRKTTLFAPNYEKIIEDGVTRELCYIRANGQLIAIYEKSATEAGRMLYAHTDHLGSIVKLTNIHGSAAFSATYDTWGQRTVTIPGETPRGNLKPEIDMPSNDPNDDSPPPPPTSPIKLYRGFTGHEHLPEFGLINMNGRLYNPLIGRFLSPDPYVPNMEYSQDFNRYSYARNNPMRYTDPTGEFVWTIITGVVDLIRTVVWKGGLDFTNKNARQNAWSNFDPSASWSRTNKAVLIDMGLFRNDPNKDFWGSTWEMISRHTWQGPQTAIGYLAGGIHNLFGGVKSVTTYGGATALESYSSDWGAIALSNFLIGQRGMTADPDNYLFQHEYGHYLQSQATGPLYFQRYGIPSLFSGGPFKDNHNYHPAEQDANARALKYFNKHVEGFLDNDGWNFGKNPIIGYSEHLPFNDPQNQLALKYARLRPAWHDWVLGPNYIISGPAINTPVLNSKKRYYKKLDLMKTDEFEVDWYYKFGK